MSAIYRTKMVLPPQRWTAVSPFPVTATAIGMQPLQHRRVTKCCIFHGTDHDTHGWAGIPQAASLIVMEPKKYYRIPLFRDELLHSIH